MLIGYSYTINNRANHSSTPIYMGNTVISGVTSQKCLGVYIDQKLTWEDHIEKICKKASAGIGAIRSLKPFVPTTSLTTIYRALVQPYFDHRSPLWDTCGKVQRDKLQKLQSRAARVITGANYEISSTDILNQLQWPTLDSRRSRAKSILMYKILNNQCAPCLRNLFLKVSDCDKKCDLRNTNTDLALPKPKTNFLKCSFQYSGATLWNSLKEEAKIAKSLGEFRRKIIVPDARLR